MQLFNLLYRIILTIILLFLTTDNIFSFTTTKIYQTESFQDNRTIILKENKIKTTNKSSKIANRNILTNDMLNQSHTRYVIMHDFDLNGAEITIPEGCIIDFQGGSFYNGSIYNSFNLSLNYNETSVVKIRSSQLIFKHCSNLTFQNLKINGEGATTEDYHRRGVISIIDCYDVKFYKLYIYGNNKTGEIGICLGIKNCTKILVNQAYCTFNGWPIFFDSVHKLTYINSISDGCYDGIKITGVCKDISIFNNTCINSIRDGVDFAGHSIYNFIINNNLFKNNKLLCCGVKTLNREAYPLTAYNIVEKNVTFDHIYIQDNICVGYKSKETHVMIELCDNYSHRRENKPVIEISNNSIKGIGNKEVGIRYIFTGHKGSCKILNNRFICTKRAMLIANTKGLTIEKNDIDSTECCIEFQNQFYNGKANNKDIYIINNQFKTCNLCVRVLNNSCDYVYFAYNRLNSNNKDNIIFGSENFKLYKNQGQ